MTLEQQIEKVKAECNQAKARCFDENGNLNQSAAEEFNRLARLLISLRGQLREQQVAA